MKVSILVSVFICLLSFNSIASAATKLAPNTYRATSVTGSAQWQDSANGLSEPLLPDKILPAGAIISTGEASSVVIVFASGSTAVVGEKSQVVISKFQQELFDGVAANEPKGEPSVSQTEIKLNKGTISSRVSKLRPQSTYVIKTPIGAAGVRGTTFQVVYDPVNKTLAVLTAEGEVVFTSLANVDIPVDGGQEIKIFFDLDENGNLKILNTINGALTQSKIDDILKLFETLINEAKLLLEPKPTSVILSKDTL
ncbi:MAG: hypothetical protein RIQ79_2446 [Verrucomicrobiota bacterium]|jgi:hypothetical protein